MQNSHSGEWMIFESSRIQQPFMVTLNHGNNPVVVKKPDWFVVIESSTQMVSMREGLQSLEGLVL